MSDTLQTILRSAATPKTNADVALLGKYARKAADHIDAQAAEIERLRGALAGIHGSFVHGSKKLYATPDATLDSIRATAANALKGT